MLRCCSLFQLSTVPINRSVFVGSFDEVALDALDRHVAVLGMLGVGIREFLAGDAGVVTSGATQVLLQQLLEKLTARRHSFSSLLVGH